MTNRGKPTAQYIIDLRTHLIKLWEQAHTDWAKVDSYYNRTFSLWETGVQRNSYHPATPASIVDHAVDQFVSSTPIPHKKPFGKTQQHKEEADRIEPAVGAIMVAAALLEPLLTWKQLNKHIVLYGYTVVEGPMAEMASKPSEPVREDGEDDDDFEVRMLEYKQERKAWLPIRIRAPHPARVLMDPLEKHPEESIKIVKRYARDVGLLLKKRRVANQWQGRSDPFELIKTTEYWSKGWHALFADDDLLFMERNSWRIMPHKHAFSDAGQEPTNEDEVNPSYMAVSILAPIMESLKAEAQMESGRLNALLEATYQTRATTGEPSEVAAQYAQGDIIRQATHKGDVWWEEIPNLPAWVFQGIAEINRDIEEGTYARTLTGLREPGVSTVGQQTILSVAASYKFKGIVEQSQHLASLVASDILRLTKVVGEPITAGGFILDPKDIQDYDINITFELKDPILQLQQDELAMRKYAEGVMSLETLWSVTGLEDASGERERLLMQDVERTPELHNILMMAAAQKAGIFELVEEMRKRNRMVQSGQGQLMPGQSAILGPDGQPLRRTLGAGSVEDEVNAPQGAMEALRAALLGRAGMTPTIPSGNGRVGI